MKKENRGNFLIVCKRNYSYDLIRTLAILCVILCHSLEIVYSVDIQQYLTMNIFNKIFRNVVFTIGRLGVPLFLFLSGALVLNKKFESKEDIKFFYKRNLFPLVLATEIWIIIYNFFDIIIRRKDNLKRYNLGNAIVKTCYIFSYVVYADDYRYLYSDSIFS